ncbi:TetR/AcrR family transcriptional regulator [Ureibacillus sp. FSL K6-0165]|uniref:TetR/AcrR family transcriptional regulator n=1 Tax=Ureibacillus sp. FSL K6-0165 TaxID=2954606 RepID=UPI0030F6EE48
MARDASKPVLTPKMIMDVARDLFVKNGYQQVSMRQIAKELGCSHGALYYHFQSKAELFFALVKEYFVLLEQELNNVLQKDIENLEKLEQCMLGYIKFGLNHQSHYEIMFMLKDDEVRNFINEQPMKVYEKFANALYTLSNKKLQLKDIWSIFISLHGFVSHYLSHVVSYEDIESAAIHHVKFLLKGVC